MNKTAALVFAAAHADSVITVNLAGSPYVHLRPEAFFNLATLHTYVVAGDAMHYESDINGVRVTTVVINSEAVA